MGIFEKSVVGIEFDSTEIRAIHLKGTPGKPRLVTYGRMQLQEGAVKDGKVQSPWLLSEAISNMWEKYGIKCRNVILGINNQDIIVRFAAFPKVPEDKIDNMIRFQSENYIPIPIEETELDYAVLGEDISVAPLQLKVLLVAARKQMLFDYINAMNKARLNVIDIGVSMLSLERLIPISLKNVPLIIVNLSNDFGNIVISDGKKLGFARTFSYNTVVIEAIKNCKIDEKMLETFCEFIAGEIRSSVFYYQNQYPNVNIQEIAITGGLSRINGFTQRLKENLEINVYSFDGLEGFDTNNSKNNTDLFFSADFAVCASLALRGLEE